MTITTTELRIIIGKHMTLAENEDIVITNNGETVATIEEPREERNARMLKQLNDPDLNPIDALRGIIKGDPETDKNITAKSIREERVLKKYYGDNV